MSEFASFIVTLYVIGFVTFVIFLCRFLYYLGSYFKRKSDPLE